jgi:hypothetical protein
MSQTLSAIKPIHHKDELKKSNSFERFSRNICNAFAGSERADFLNCRKNFG